MLIFTDYVNFGRNSCACRNFCDGPGLRCRRDGVGTSNFFETPKCLPGLNLWHDFCFFNLRAHILSATLSYQVRACAQPYFPQLSPHL
jgi:hypothetical protein